MNIHDLESQLDIDFNDKMLLENAFVHRSYLNESSKFKESNERLEYLGDAVLELATSEFLFRTYARYQEGMLTNLRAALVRTTTLAETAQKLGLDKLVLMSKGEEDTGGRSNPSILANATEAFIGAVYLDQGYETVSKILDTHLFVRAKNIIKQASYKDSKSALQEIAQAEMKATPEYELISQEGPDHDKEFTMQVVIDGHRFALGQGKSKQLAQEAAARRTLEMMTNT